MNAYDPTQATDEDSFSNPVPHYVERYGLTSAPFSSQHEDRFVYLDAERLQRLNMLEHLTRYSELLLIITGQKGIGKTSLLQRFVLNIDEDTIVGQINANPMMDANKLLQAITTGFGLHRPDDDPVALQDALYHHLAALHHQEKTPLLIIDDAHVLPQDALEALFNLAEAEVSDGNLLRIILFSDPQIETMLQSPAIQDLRERVTHSMNIPPFDEEQTVGYIRHRLSVAGLQGKLPFSSKELHKIFRNSGGIPARINECAHLILNGDKLDQAIKDFHTPRINVRPNLKLPAALLRFMPSWQLAAAIVAVLSVGLVLVYQDAINALFEADSTQHQQTDNTVKIPASPAEKPAPPLTNTVTRTTAPEPALPQTSALETPTAKPEPIPAPPQAATAAETVTSPTPSQKKINTPVTAADPPSSTGSKTEKQPPTASPEPEPTPPAAPAPVITDISPNPIRTSRKPQTLAILGEHFSKDMNVTVFWSGGHKTLSARQINIISPNEMELKITVGRQPDSWKIRLQDPLSKQQTEAHFKVVAATTKTARPVQGTGLNGEDWIRTQNPQYFTLQLLGSQRKDSLKKFAKRHQLAGDVAWFAGLRNRQPWYVLIQGRYTSRAQAQDAARTLVKNIRGIKPWIRPFADIQKTLKQQAVTPPPAAIAAAPTPPPASDKTTSAAWLWSQDPSHYTLQLLGGQTEDGILRFIHQHKLTGKAVYYRTIRNNRPWYVLVYNSYPNYASAKAAITTLPTSLRKTQPWPRSFAGIHAELQ